MSYKIASVNFHNPDVTYILIPLMRNSCYDYHMSEVDENYLSLVGKIAEQKLSTPPRNVLQVIDKGEVNQVYVLTLKGSQKYVLRLNNKSYLKRLK